MTRVSANPALSRATSSPVQSSDEGLLRDKVKLFADAYQEFSQRMEALQGEEHALVKEVLTELERMKLHALRSKIETLKQSIKS